MLLTTGGDTPVFNLGLIPYSKYKYSMLRSMLRKLRKHGKQITQWLDSVFADMQ